MAAGGRDQRVPMERLTQILFVLSRSPDRTATTDRLLEHVAYGSDKVEDRRRQLTRDIRHLTDLGWGIAAVGADGEAGRYRLVAGDLRLRVEFPAAEQAELQRAARVAELSGSAAAGPGRAGADAVGAEADGAGADRAGADGAGADRAGADGAGADGAGAERAGADGADDFATGTEAVTGLDPVQRAVQAHCLLRFTYRGTRREVHPHRVHLRTGGWYLRAREVDGDEVKTFRLDRLEDVVLGQPGTADVPPPDAHLRIDPIAWQVDEAVTALVATTPEHVPQVRSMLAGPDPGAVVTHEDPASCGGHAGEVVLGVPVTHRSAFRGRLYELGARVRLLGPDALREEVRVHLTAVAEGRR